MKEFPPIDQSFEVAYSYKLYSSNQVFSKSNPLLADIIRSDIFPVPVLFVIDQNVAKHHPDLEQNIFEYCSHHKNLKHAGKPILVPGGEQVKNNDKYIQNILGVIESEKICRHSFIVAIGGGAVIDMVGFAAAIAHRGVRLIRIPTTVLSQNDAAVGVKNSINAFGKKNFTGTFSPPYAIINDKQFLKTLEFRDWISGIAEAVKVSLIKDAEFYQYIKNNAKALNQRKSESMEYLIYRCAQLHMQHISSADPFESGSSRPLDFGHWAAHKLEHMTNYQLRHGEAVAKGMGIDIVYSSLLGYLPEKDQIDALNVLLSIGFDLEIPVHSKAELDELMLGIEEFREHLGGKLTITLLSGIGKKMDVHDIDLDIMGQAITTLNNFSLSNNISEKANKNKSA